VITSNAVFVAVTAYVLVAGMSVSALVLLGVLTYRVIVRTRRRPR